MRMRCWNRSQCLAIHARRSSRKCWTRSIGRSRGTVTSTPDRVTLIDSRVARALRLSRHGTLSVPHRRLICPSRKPSRSRSEVSSENERFLGKGRGTLERWEMWHSLAHGMHKLIHRYCAQAGRPEGLQFGIAHGLRGYPRPVPAQHGTGATVAVYYTGAQSPQALSRSVPPVPAK